MKLFDRWVRSPKWPRDEYPIPVVVDATGVIAWLMEQQQEFLDLQSVAPPWDRFFIQSDWNSEIVANDKSYESIVPLNAVGLYVVNLPKDHPDFRAGSAWTIECHIVFGVDKRTTPRGEDITPPWLVSIVELNENGQPYMMQVKSVLTGLGGLSGHELDDTDAEFAERFSFSLLKAVDFLHCRNVGLELVEPPPKLSKKHERKHGHPLYAYNTLVVRAGGKKYVLDNSYTSKDNSGNTVSLHQVRGHFKTYTADKPLMGKAVGRFFWPSFLRGDPDRGLREKDYKIEGPK